MEEMFNKFIRNKITPNQFYVLYCIREKVSSNLVKNFQVEIKSLKLNGFLLEENKISSKGTKFLREVEGFFKRAKKATSKELMGKDFGEKMKKYNELFPKIRLKSGKPARSAISNVETCFRWFFDKHEYDWETIYKATKLYMNEMDNGANKYTTCSHYFIRKQNTGDRTFNSVLADYCNAVELGIEDEDVHFKEHTFDN